jgi:hypothetical protein
VSSDQQNIDNNEPNQAAQGIFYGNVNIYNISAMFTYLQAENDRLTKENEYLRATQEQAAEDVILEETDKLKVALVDVLHNANSLASDLIYAQNYIRPLVVALASASEHARSRDQAITRTKDHANAHVHEVALSCDLTRAQDHARYCNQISARARDIVDVLDRASTYIKDYARMLDLAVVRTQGLARAQNLANDLVRAQDLTRTLDHFSAHARALAKNSTLVWDTVSDMASNHTQYLACGSLCGKLDHARSHAHACGLALAFRLFLDIRVMGIRRTSETVLGAEHPAVVAFKQNVALFEEYRREYEEEERRQR